MRDRLLAAGLSPAHVQRTLTELSDHFEDLLAEAEAGGAENAEQQACEQLGRLDVIAAELCRAPDLKGWAWRWPRLALVVYPLACMIALPAVPIVAGVEHAASVMRWMAGLLLAAMITAGMFLALQLAIMFS